MDVGHRRIPGRAA